MPLRQKAGQVVRDFARMGICLSLIIIHELPSRANFLLAEALSRKLLKKRDWRQGGNSENKSLYDDFTDAHGVSRF